MNSTASLHTRTAGQHLDLATGQDIVSGTVIGSVSYEEDGYYMTINRTDYMPDDVASIVAILDAEGYSLDPASLGEILDLAPAVAALDPQTQIRDVA